MSAASFRKGEEVVKVSVSCIIPQYATLKTHVLKFYNLLGKVSDKTVIPIEWIVDVADESNCWFFGTAYSYNDAANTINVMVPDRNNPVFEGNIILDSQLVRLVECVDSYSAALFNKVVRDSMIKVRWQLEWFDGDLDYSAFSTSCSRGRWMLATAHYYIKFTKQLLIESPDFFESGKFVLIVADLGVRLLSCPNGKGQKEFERAIRDKIVLYEPDVVDSAGQCVRLRRSSLQVAKSLASVNDICRLPNLKSSKQQVERLSAAVSRLPDSSVVPVEWIVDVYDESHRWFFGTAYSYNDVNNTIHVMVPDKFKPVFEGDLKLESQLVRLVECVDSHSVALFQKLLRDSTIKVNWQVEWFDGEDVSGQGKWWPCTAYYYVKFTNQLMLKQVSNLDETANCVTIKKGFFLSSGDQRLRFLRCNDKQGLAEYEQLIRCGDVQSAPKALDVNHLLTQQMSVGGAATVPEVIIYDRMEVVAALGPPPEDEDLKPAAVAPQNLPPEPPVTVGEADSTGTPADINVYPGNGISAHAQTNHSEQSFIARQPFLSPPKEQGSLPVVFSPCPSPGNDLLEWLHSVLKADVDVEYIEYCFKCLCNDFIRSKEALANIPSIDLSHEYLKSIGIEKVSVRWILKRNHAKMAGSAVDIKEWRLPRGNVAEESSSSDEDNDSTDKDCGIKSKSSTLSSSSFSTTGSSGNVKISTGDNIVLPTHSDYDPDVVHKKSKPRSITRNVGSTSDGEETASSVASVDARFRASMAHPDENIQLLKTQLEARNIKPLEFIPLTEIRAEISSLTAAANAGESFDEDRLDFLIACMEINSEYIAEKEAERQAWKVRLEGFTAECIQTMRGFIPPDIHRETAASLECRGLSKALVNRIVKKKCLWLIRMEPGYISRLHEADLLGTYSPACQQLDIVETTAIYGCLPEKFSNDASGRKRDWKLRLESEVRKLVTAKESNQLASHLCRFAAYKSLEVGPFADDSNLFSIDVTSSEGAFAPKNDFKQISTSHNGSSAGTTDDDDCSSRSSGAQSGFSPRKLSMSSMTGANSATGRGSGASMAAEVIAAAAGGSNDDSGRVDKRAMKARLEQLLSQRKSS